MHRSPALRDQEAKAYFVGMQTPSDGTAARIVLAAVTCIERDGLPSLTIRDIAAEAGVNVAALNYYFRSKDILIAQVLRDRFDHFVQDITAIIDETSQPEEARLFDVLLYLLNGALDWPRVLQAILYTNLTDQEVGLALSDRLAEVVGKLRGVVGKEDPRAATMRAAQLVSAVVFPGVFPSMFEKLPSLGLRGPGRRAAFVRTLMNDGAD